MGAFRDPSPQVTLREILLVLPSGHPVDTLIFFANKKGDRQNKEEAEVLLGAQGPLGQRKFARDQSKISNIGLVCVSKPSKE